MDNGHVAWLQLPRPHQALQCVIKVALDVVGVEATTLVCGLERVGQAQNRLGKHVVKAGNVLVRVDSLSTEDNGFFVPAELKS